MIHLRELSSLQSSALTRLHLAGKTLGATLRKTAKTRPGLWVGIAVLALFGVAWAIVKLMLASGGATVLALLRDTEHQVGGGGIPGAGGAGGAGGVWSDIGDRDTEEKRTGTRPVFVKPGMKTAIYSSVGGSYIGTAPERTRMMAPGYNPDSTWTKVITPSGKVGYTDTSRVSDRMAGESMTPGQAMKLFDTGRSVRGSSASTASCRG